MSELPDPVPGLVIRYSYLWSREADEGEETGRKGRPCSVLVALRKHAKKLIVYVAPITHSQPSSSTGGVELPPAVKRRLGLDAQRSWVITTEFNAFPWPGPDVLAVDPSEDVSEFFYGSLPKSVADGVIAQFRSNLALHNVRAVKRTE